MLPEEIHIASTIPYPSPLLSTALCPLPDISFWEVDDEESIVRDASVSRQSVVYSPATPVVTSSSTYSTASDTAKREVRST